MLKITLIIPIYDCDGGDSRNHRWRVKMSRRTGWRAETTFVVQLLKVLRRRAFSHGWNFLTS